ncbi:MAG: hypothetical protein ACRDT4_21565 [Micromonosporaceae bacterium]
MTRVVRVIAVLMLLASVAGCGSGLKARWSQPPPAATPSAPATSPSPSVSTDTVKDCFDGDCLLSVDRPTVVPLHRRFGISRLEVSVSDGSATIRASFGSGGGGEASTGAGSTITVGTLVIKVVAADNGTALLDFTP